MGVLKNRRVEKITGMLGMDESWRYYWSRSAMENNKN